MGVALISKRATLGVILGVAGCRYTSGPFTPQWRKRPMRLSDSLGDAPYTAR